MKYISKKFQKYMSKNDKDLYSSLKKERIKIKNDYNKVISNHNRSFLSQRNNSLVNLSRKILKIDEQILDIEFQTFELAEKDICKEGHIICHDRMEKIKLVIQEKKNRDYYNCVSLESLNSERSLHWKTIVKYYSLDKISEI